MTLVAFTALVATASSTATTGARSNALFQLLQLETDMLHVFHLLSVLGFARLQAAFFEKEPRLKRLAKKLLEAPKMLTATSGSH